MDDVDALEALCRFTLAAALVAVLDEGRRRRWGPVLAADVPCGALAESVAMLRRELGPTGGAADVAAAAESALHDLRRARDAAEENGAGRGGPATWSTLHDLRRARDRAAVGYADACAAACRRACRDAAAQLPHTEHGLMCALVGAGVEPGQAVAATAVACGDDPWGPGGPR